MPVLLGSIDGGRNDVEARATASASSVTAPPVETSAVELLDGTNVTRLLRAGARDESQEPSLVAEPFVATTGTASAGSLADTAGKLPATQPPSDDSSSPAADSEDAEPERPASAPAAPAPPSTAPTAPPATAPPATAPPATAPPATAPPATAPAPTAPATTVPPPAATEPAAGEPTAAQWEALRQCEAWGNYGVVSGNGRYFGAYQFSQGTWNNVARLSGRSDLVGVRPSDASPTDQDAMALALWRSSGWSSWPSCGAKAAVA